MKRFSKIIILILVFFLFVSPSFAFGKQKKEGKGYVGELPDISKFFRYKKGSTTSNPESGLIVEPVTKSNMIKGPMNDPVFVDIIIKKQKPSKYTDDLIKILPVVEKLRNIVKENSDIQKYNAGVNTLDLYVTKLQKNYENTNESISKSYTALQDVNYRAKVLGNLKYEANFYSKYKPVLEEQYTPQYLEYHDKLLIQELDKTIFIIQQECDKAQFGKI